MLNQFVGVGRLVAEPSAKEMEDGKKVSNITITIILVMIWGAKMKTENMILISLM